MADRQNFSGNVRTYDVMAMRRQAAAMEGEDGFLAGLEDTGGPEDGRPTGIFKGAGPIPSRPIPTPDNKPGVVLPGKGQAYCDPSSTAHSDNTESDAVLRGEEDSDLGRELSASQGMVIGGVHYAGHSPNEDVSQAGELVTDADLEVEANKPLLIGIDTPKSKTPEFDKDENLALTDRSEGDLFHDAEDYEKQMDNFANPKKGQAIHESVLKKEAKERLIPVRVWFKAHPELEFGELMYFSIMRGSRDDRERFERDIADRVRHQSVGNQVEEDIFLLYNKEFLDIEFTLAGYTVEQGGPTVSKTVWDKELLHEFEWLEREAKVILDKGVAEVHSYTHPDEYEEEYDVVEGARKVKAAKPLLIGPNAPAKKTPKVDADEMRAQVDRVEGTEFFDADNYDEQMNNFASPKKNAPIHLKAMLKGAAEDSKAVKAAHIWDAMHPVERAIWLVFNCKYELRVGKIYADKVFKELPANLVADVEKAVKGGFTGDIDLSDIYSVKGTEKTADIPSNKNRSFVSLVDEGLDMGKTLGEAVWRALECDNPYGFNESTKSQCAATVQKYIEIYKRKKGTVAFKTKEPVQITPTKSIPQGTEVKPVGVSNDTDPDLVGEFQGKRYKIPKAKLDDAGGLNPQPDVPTSVTASIDDEYSEELYAEVVEELFGKDVDALDFSLTPEEEEQAWEELEKRQVAINAVENDLKFDTLKENAIASLKHKADGAAINADVGPALDTGEGTLEGDQMLHHHKDIPGAEKKIKNDLGYPDSQLEEDDGKVGVVASIDPLQVSPNEARAEEKACERIAVELFDKPFNSLNEHDTDEVYRVYFEEGENVKGNAGDAKFDAARDEGFGKGGALTEDWYKGKYSKLAEGMSDEELKRAIAEAQAALRNGTADCKYTEMLLAYKPALRQRYIDRDRQHHKGLGKGGVVKRAGFDLKRMNEVAMEFYHRPYGELGMNEAYVVFLKDRKRHNEATPGDLEDYEVYDMVASRLFSKYFDDLSPSEVERVLEYNDGSELFGKSRVKKANYEMDAPYRCDWDFEKEKAARMSVKELRWAIKDAFEASKGLNGGKYMDQISIYRPELERKLKQQEAQNLGKSSAVQQEVEIHELLNNMKEDEVFMHEWNILDTSPGQRFKIVRDYLGSHNISADEASMSELFAAMRDATGGVKGIDASKRVMAKGVHLSTTEIKQFLKRKLLKCEGEGVPYQYVRRGSGDLYVVDRELIDSINDADEGYLDYTEYVSDVEPGGEVLVLKGGDGREYVFCGSDRSTTSAKCVVAQEESETPSGAPHHDEMLTYLCKHSDVDESEYEDVLSNLTWPAWEVEKFVAWAVATGVEEDLKVKRGYYDEGDEGEGKKQALPFIEVPAVIRDMFEFFKGFGKQAKSRADLVRMIVEEGWSHREGEAFCGFLEEQGIRVPLGNKDVSNIDSDPRYRDMVVDDKAPASTHDVSTMDSKSLNKKRDMLLDQLNSETDPTKKEQIKNRLKSLSFLLKLQASKLGEFVKEVPVEGKPIVKRKSPDVVAPNISQSEDSFSGNKEQAQDYKKGYDSKGASLKVKSDGFDFTRVSSMLSVPLSLGSMNQVMVNTLADLQVEAGPLPESAMPDIADQRSQPKNKNLPGADKDEGVTWKSKTDDMFDPAGMSEDEGELNPATDSYKPSEGDYALTQRPAWGVGDTSYREGSRRVKTELPINTPGGSIPRGLSKGRCGSCGELGILTRGVCRACEFEQKQEADGERNYEESAEREYKRQERNETTQDRMRKERESAKRRKEIGDELIKARMGKDSRKVKAASQEWNPDSIPVGMVGEYKDEPMLIMSNNGTTVRASIESVSIAGAAVVGVTIKVDPRDAAKAKLPESSVIKITNQHLTLRDLGIQAFIKASKGF